MQLIHLARSQGSEEEMAIVEEILLNCVQEGPAVVRRTIAPGWLTAGILERICAGTGVRRARTPVVVVGAVVVVLITVSGMLN